MSQDFLSRWSRRKRGEAPIKDEPAALPAVSEPSADALAADEITPEDLAALPPIDEITAQTDLVAFLKKGVPLVLRNAALKRMWVLDPAIRDFVGDARDYAWDWNTPGGVPCSGPLESGTDIPAMLKRIVGGESDAEPVSHANVIEPKRPAQERAAEPPPPPPETSTVSEIPQDIHEDEVAEPADLTTPRRHGGALPANA